MHTQLVTQVRERMVMSSLLWQRRESMLLVEISKQADSSCVQRKEHMSSTEALVLVYSNLRAGNWSAQSSWGEVYLHGKVLDTHQHDKLHIMLSPKPDSPRGWDQQKTQVDVYCLVHKWNGVGPVKPAPCTYITRKRFCFYCGRIRSCMLFLLCLNNNYALLPGYMGGGKSGLVSAIVHIHVWTRVYK